MQEGKDTHARRQARQPKRANIPAQEGKYAYQRRQTRLSERANVPAKDGWRALRYAVFGRFYKRRR
nr:hypothetical protein [uncultured bacterium]